MGKRNLQKYKKAIEAIDIAIKIVPESTEYISEAVIFNIEAKKFSDAEKLCKKLIELNDKFIFAYIKLAEIYVKQIRFSDALENIDKILELDINTPEAYIMKAKIYKENKLYEQAIDFVKQAITLSPDTNEYYALIADIYYINNLSLL